MDNTNPLVSVIIVSYNHQDYIEDCLLSVINQTYQHVEIIIIDDGSTDNSAHVIKSLNVRHPKIISILNPKNIGYCSTFNSALQKASGAYIIDLAGDDILYPNKIELQIARFQKLDESYGIVYSDLTFIDEKGNDTSLFRKHIKFPEGDLHNQLVEKHFIYAATMLIKKDVFDDLDGYDETLSFEDLDFFIRSSKNWKYGCIKQPTIKKRVHTTSLSQQKKKSPVQTQDTLRILNTLQKQPLDKRTKTALRRRYLYEAKEALNNGFYSLGLKMILASIVI